MFCRRNRFFLRSRCLKEKDMRKGKRRKSYVMFDQIIQKEYEDSFQQQKEDTTRRECKGTYKHRC